MVPTLVMKQYEFREVLLIWIWNYPSGTCSESIAIHPGIAYVQIDFFVYPARIVRCPGFFPACAIPPPGGNIPLALRGGVPLRDDVFMVRILKYLREFGVVVDFGRAAHGHLTLFSTSSYPSKETWLGYHVQGGQYLVVGGGGSVGHVGLVKAVSALCSNSSSYTWIMDPCLKEERVLWVDWGIHPYFTSSGLGILGIISPPFPSIPPNAFCIVLFVLFGFVFCTVCWLRTWPTLPEGMGEGREAKPGLVP